MSALLTKQKLILVASFILTATLANTQHQDYIGAGHDQGITVTASSSFTNTAPENTINGKGLDAELMEASRFLDIATFGKMMPEVERLMAMGKEAWIDEQLNMQSSEILPLMESIWATIFSWKINAGEEPDDIFGPYSLHFNYAWWQNMITCDDQLRQRMAYALSQILVISTNSDLRDHAEGLSSYYDMLIGHSFGNYKDLLLDVTLNVNMGFYLSHLNNPKADPDNNVHPDENYAREIMQLFSIGLYELNQDGTQKKDGAGNLIPTYDNDDIRELAEVFTGLYPGGIADYIDWTDEPYFGLGLWGADRTVPMQMDEDYHDKSSKILINGKTLPAGQSGLKDIEDAVDHLFNHPNVGPFLSRQLIQRFVKSNPTPGYISRVAGVFNNNGEGVRGDLGAVIKAILLDEEATTCASYDDPTSGKLVEPMLRYTQACRSFPVDNAYGNFWNPGYNFMDQTGQMILGSPTVFNFYLPDFQPVGDIANAGLVAPEFKLHNTRNSIGYINNVNAWVVWNGLFYSWEGEYIDDTGTRMVTSELENMIDDDHELVINQLDVLLTNGQLSDEMRNEIRTAMNGLEWGEYQYNRTRMAIYLMLISPDFNVFK